MASKLDANHLSSTHKIKQSFSQGSSYTMREPDYDERLAPRLERFIDSFRRDPNTMFTAEEHDEAVRQRQGGDSHYYDLHMATLENAHIGLSRRLKGRHLQMIAIGGSIGTVASSVFNS